MSAITQRVPNLYRGISQQPDNRKFPGQVRDAVNVFPDYALGMLKRPGGKYVSDLKGATSGGRWFSILRDALEKYVVQYDNNIFRVWSLIDGSPRMVDMGTNTGVPASCNTTDYASKLLTFNNEVADVKQKETTLKAAQKTFAEVSAGQLPTTESLFEFNYIYNDVNIKERLLSGVLLDINGTYLIKDKSVHTTPLTQFTSGYSRGAERTTDHPNLASEGYRIFELIKTVPAVNTTSELTSAQNALTTAEADLATAIADRDTAETNLDTQVSNCAITSNTGAYLNGAEPDDIEVLTLNDVTFVLNKKKEVAMTTSVENALPNEAFVVINVVAYKTSYTVILDVAGTLTTITHTTPDVTSSSAVDANSIASDLTTQINNLTGFTAVQVGPGIYISSTSAFGVETRGGSQQDSLYSFQSSLPTVSRLPIQAKNGYKLKLINTAEIEVDDQWVRFETSNGQTYGAGAWVESRAPGMQYELDPSTLPHRLTREATGNFSFRPVVWNDRLVGNDPNNENLPSFVGNTINSMFIFRNRFGFLSNDNVVLSKAGDFFNFFETSASVPTADDPIDISATSTRPVTLNHAQATSAGLAVFGENDQFLMSTDSDILSPTSAKVDKLSSFECDPDVTPISVGTSTAFLSKTPLYTHLFELFEVSREQPPVTRDTTQTLAEFIPESIDSLVASPGLSILSLATKGSSDVYQYRFLQSGNERLVETWYRWSLTGTLLDQFFDNSTYFAVVYDGTRAYVMSFEMNQASDAGVLTLKSGEKTDTCLDLWSDDINISYNSSTDVSTLTLPIFRTGDTRIALVNTTDGSLLYPTVSLNSNTCTVAGDLRGQSLISGFTYNMRIDLPKLYVYKQESSSSVNQDSTSNLVIHRLKFSTGLSGPIDYKLSITGIPDWSNSVNVTLPDQYNLDDVNMLPSATHNVPVYQRNENVLVRIEGDTPFPISLLGYTWEGRYTDKFYQRA